MNVPRNKGARVLAISAALFLSFLVQVWISSAPDRMGDFTWYKMWGESIDSNGINNAFFSEKPPRIDYLPLVPYILGACAAINKAVEIKIPGDLTKSEDLIFKLPFLVSNILIGLSLFLILHPRAGFLFAFASMGLYTFNPAIIFNTAYWGQSDAIHALLLLLTLHFLIDKKKPEISWAMYTLAAFAKPQAWALAPLVFLLTIQDFGPRRWAQSVIACLATALLILSPFIVEGNTGRILHHIFNATDVAYIAINPHNFWWLTTGGLPWVPAQSSAFWGITYKQTSLALLAFFYSAALWQLIRAKQPEHRWFFAMLLAFGFFMFGPGMRENYMFTLFPFFSLICLLDRRLFYAYAVLTLTFLLNMLLHDPYLMIRYYYKMTYDWSFVSSGAFYRREFVSDHHLLLTLVNAALNITVFIYLIYYARKRIDRLPSYGSNAVIFSR